MHRHSRHCRNITNTNTVLRLLARRVCNCASLHTLMPTQGHVDDQDMVDEESREKESRIERSLQSQSTYDALILLSSGKSSGDLRGSASPFSICEQLVNGSSSGSCSGSGSGSGKSGDVHGHPAVLAPAKSREKTPRMVYDWEGKEELCYKLYITENKSLEEIMEFFKVTQDFTPRYVSCRVVSCRVESSRFD